MYLINFTELNRTFCLSLHYSGENSYLFVNCKEIHKFTAKDSEIVPTPLCLGNNLKDWSVDNMKMAGLNWYVYGFSVNYNVVHTTAAIPHIYKYLMIENYMV